MVVAFTLGVAFTLLLAVVVSITFFVFAFGFLAMIMAVLLTLCVRIGVLLHVVVRYACGVLDDPGRWLPGLPSVLARRLARRWIAAGRGCDCDLEPAPATAEPPR